MNWKALFRLTLLSLCFTAGISSAQSAATTPSVPEEAPTAETATTGRSLPPMETEETTEAASINTGFERWDYEYPSTCYIEKSKATELITRMNQTVQLLNRKDKFVKCYDEVKVVKLEGEPVEMCSDDRIQQIQKDIIEVAAGLIELAIQTSEPSPQEVNRLDLKKFRLVDSLNALRVFYGPSPCDGSLVVLYPLGPLIELLEWNLGQKIALFNEPRMKRPVSTIPTSTMQKPGFDGMLNPDKSFTELKEMAKLNPAAMSRAIPQIVSQRYNGRASKFDSLLNFIESLPDNENQIFGLSAVYDEMYRYNRNPETQKLIKLAQSVQRLKGSVTTLETAATLKFDDLKEDRELNPLIQMLDPQKSFPELIELARSNSPAMSISISEIVSQRYSVSSFDNLLNFIQDLPTTENQIVGFVALYEDLKRRNILPIVPQMLKLAGPTKHLNELAGASSSFIGLAAWSKFADIVHELSPLILTGEKAYCQVTNVAYQRQLHVYDPGWPESAYVYQNLSQTIDHRIYPRVKSNNLIFYILEGDEPLYASDTNPNTRDTIYAAKSFERFVLEDYKNVTVTKQLNREMEWKIIPVKNRQGQFRILSAKYEDFMFVHKSATGDDDRRRVLLGKKSHPNHDMISDADLWTLKCRAGSYNLPSD